MTFRVVVVVVVGGGGKVGRDKKFNFTLELALFPLSCVGLAARARNPTYN